MAFALAGLTACIIGPKQDDPESAADVEDTGSGGAEDTKPATPSTDTGAGSFGESGLAADVGTSSDTATTDAVSDTDAASDTGKLPCGDAGDAGDSGDVGDGGCSGADGGGDAITGG